MSIIIFDSLYFFFFLIALIALIVFYFVKKSFAHDYDNRVVPDFYDDLDTETDEVERLVGSSYAKQYIKNYEGAINDLTKAIKLDSGSEKAYLLRGKLYIEIRKHKKALIDLTKVLQINSENKTAYYYRGKARYALGDVYEASKDFEKAESLGFTYEEK